MDVLFAHELKLQNNSSFYPDSKEVIKNAIWLKVQQSNEA